MLENLLHFIAGAVVCGVACWLGFREGKRRAILNLLLEGLKLVNKEKEEDVEK